METERLDAIKKEQIKSIVLSSVCIVLGILFCIIPLKMHMFVETVVCFAVLLYGIAAIVVYCLWNSEEKSMTLLIKGAAATAVGLLLIFVPALLVVCMGLIVVLSGAIYIKSAILDKKAGDDKWWIAVIFGVVLSVLGIITIILYNTAVGAKIAMIIYGITIILDGSVRLFYTFVIQKELHSLFEKQEKTEEETEETTVETKEETVVEKPKPAKQETIEEDDDDDGVEGFVDADETEENEESEKEGF